MSNIRPKGKITDERDVLDFGKYRGKTVRQVLDLAPDYLLWLDFEEIVEVPESILEDAEEISRLSMPPEEWFLG